MVKLLIPMRKELKSTPAQLRAAKKYYEKHRKSKIEKVLLNRERKHPWRSFEGHFEIIYAELVKTAKRKKLDIYPKNDFWGETQKDYTNAYECWRHFKFHPAMTPMFDIHGEAWTGRWWMHKKMIHPVTGEWTNPLESLKPEFGVFAEEVFIGTEDEITEAWNHSADLLYGIKCEDPNCKFVEMLRPKDDIKTEKEAPRRLSVKIFAGNIAEPVESSTPT